MGSVLVSVVTKGVQGSPCFEMTREQNTSYAEQVQTRESAVHDFLNKHRVTANRVSAFFLVDYHTENNG